MSATAECMHADLDLDTEPQCQAVWNCPNCGPEVCGDPAAFVLTQPCAICGKPVNSLCCTDCGAEYLTAGISTEQLRPL
jgi:hypothetical protein